MKIFDKATLKLTGTYTAVIMVISVSFSACLGMVTVGELKRPYEVPSLFKELRVDEDFTRVYKVRTENVEAKVWTSLALININMLIINRKQCFKERLSTFLSCRKYVANKR